MEVFVPTVTVRPDICSSSVNRGVVFPNIEISTLSIAAPTLWKCTSS